MRGRTVIYEEDQRQLQAICEQLGREAVARAVFLLDKNGQILVASGETASIDVTSLASLVAGTSSATSSLARLLGEEEFTMQFHQGLRDSLFISMVSDEHILTVLFDHRSTLGLIRLRAKRASHALVEVLEAVTNRSEDPQEENIFDGLTDEDIESLFGSRL